MRDWSPAASSPRLAPIPHPSPGAACLSAAPPPSDHAGRAQRNGPGSVPRAVTECETRMTSPTEHETNEAAAVVGITNATDLPAQSQTGDGRSVALDVLLAEIGQETATPTDELQEATTGVVIVLVRAEMVGEAGDPLGEERDLDFGRAGVALMDTEAGDDLFLLSRLQRHSAGIPPSHRCRRAQTTYARRRRTIGV